MGHSWEALWALFVHSCALLCHLVLPFASCALSCALLLFVSCALACAHRFPPPSHVHIYVFSTRPLGLVHILRAANCLAQNRDFANRHIFCMGFILHLYLFVIFPLTLISRCWDYLYMFICFMFCLKHIYLQDTPGCPVLGGDRARTPPPHTPG